MVKKTVRVFYLTTDKKTDKLSEVLKDSEVCVRFNDLTNGLINYYNGLNFYKIFKF